MKKMEISNESELAAVAETVLEELSAVRSENSASVLALHGDLGSGKTAFVKTLAKTLGVTEVVTSPTFVIMKLYELPESEPPQKAQPFAVLAHIDAYRIESIDEMRVLRFEELLSQKDTIICIEWAENIEALLPSHTVHMNLEIIGETRTITIT